MSGFLVDDGRCSCMRRRVINERNDANKAVIGVSVYATDYDFCSHFTAPRELTRGQQSMYYVFGKQ